MRTDREALFAPACNKLHVRIQLQCNILQSDYHQKYHLKDITVTNVALCGDL